MPLVRRSHPATCELSILAQAGLPPQKNVSDRKRRGGRLSVMEITEHIAALGTEGTRLADLAAKTGLDAPVPTCPGWLVRDLVLHTGQVHRWATAHIADGLREPMNDAESRAVWGPDPSDAELVDWFRVGHRRLVATLEQAPDDLECWSFLPAPSPRAFWARRQAHETAIHRADAESAAGEQALIDDAVFAVDGIDELLFGMLGRPKYQLHTEEQKTLLVKPTDTADSWLMTISRDPLVTRRQTEASDADCTIAATVRELYLFLWNRLPLAAVQATGDRALLELWRETATVRWS